MSIIGEIWEEKMDKLIAEHKAEKAKMYTKEQLKELMHKAAIEFSSNTGPHAYDVWTYKTFDDWFNKTIL